MARSLVPSIFEIGFPAVRSGYDPFMQLHREMNRLFDDTLRGYGPPGSEGSSMLAGPRMNVSETDKEIRIEAELPGVPEKDVNVELTDDVLTIRGEKRAERELKDYHVVERSFGSFSRSVRLPFSAKPDQVHAAFNHGVLTVTVPKASSQERVHRIQVQAGNSGSGNGTIEASANGGGRGGQAQVGGTVPSQSQSGQSTKPGASEADVGKRT